MKKPKDEDEGEDQSEGLRRNPLALYEIPFLTHKLKQYSWTKYVPFFPTFVEKKKTKKRKRRQENEEDVV